MTLSLVRTRPGVPAADPAEALDRSVRRRVGLVWGLLFLNVLTFAAGTWNGLPLIIHIPSVVGKIITQGSLPLALLIALMTNRRLTVRPNVFLCLLTLLVVEAFMSGLHPQGHLIGTLYRTVRFAGFVATLWLLTPWWGRRDLLLVRCQLKALAVVLISILLGLMIAPGRALAQGRLSGEFWPIPPAQVADFAAVAVGLVVILWFCGRMSGRAAAPAVAIGILVLLLTHTRIEVVALLAGILVGGLSIFLSRARVRRTFVAVAIAASLGITVFSGVVTAWLARGETTQQLSSLTGRTTVWSGVVNAPRDLFQVIFGYGLSNKAYNGFPIDSNWLATYLDLGLLGVSISAVLLLFVFVSAYFQVNDTQRALALFLVVYLMITSYTETGLGDASEYLLDLALAASLLVPPPEEWRRR
ncbi:MAG: O-antigen ligase family protein [Streptosporangiaceae bacterium]